VANIDAVRAKTHKNMILFFIEYLLSLEALLNHPNSYLFMPLF